MEVGISSGSISPTAPCGTIIAPYDDPTISSSIAYVILEEGIVVSAPHEGHVVPAADAPIGGTASSTALNEEDVLAGANTVDMLVIVSVDDIDFPLLRSASKAQKNKDKDTFTGSTNKFEVLNCIVHEEKCQQPIPASLGVATLLKEIKIKKKEVLGKVSKSAECNGSGLPSVFLSMIVCF
ncbi:hypothetical protein V6N12_065258 [Hibiscus sabdariffa]|uniref:Uncharacterized protein n=1 Tax=Hibiscus sabdariffa TaxID=183260 RepID=A0ABR2G978_9ROSI